jgi:hypothetical protein
MFCAGPAVPMSNEGKLKLKEQEEIGYSLPGKKSRHKA